MSEYSIPKSKQSDVMTSFWSMMKECESSANNEHDRVLKHQVEGWYRQWNTITNSECFPVWSKQ